MVKDCQDILFLKEAETLCAVYSSPPGSGEVVCRLEAANAHGKRQS